MYFNPFDKVANDLFKMKTEIEQEYFGKMRNFNVICKHCKTTLQDFLDTGYVGCSNCYEVFKEQAKELALDIHGRVGHVGKVPKVEVTKAVIKREIERLIREKDIAVKSEEYDLAKELKVKIDRLKEELK